MRPRTKIIATIGPASQERAVLGKMIKNGLDIIRLNFSHGTREEHVKKMNLVRELNGKMRRAVGIMQDLEGYRIRIGKLKAPVTLKKGATVTMAQGDLLGDEKKVSFDYEGSLSKFVAGTEIFIDDGKIVLDVVSRGKSELKLKVMAGGLLKEHKGVNIPGIKLEFESLTKKDRDDIELGMRQKVDYVAQSFVNRAEDIRILRKAAQPFGHKCPIFAKIESRDALRNIDEIIDEADGIIVARGDLGICIPIYRVPVVQKEIIKKCRVRNKPAVVATQMLDSMTEEPFPTRAEVSDVANAILDGATHLLVSGETAVGKYPDLVVDMMNKVIKCTENYKSKEAELIL